MLMVSLKYVYNTPIQSGIKSEWPITQDSGYNICGF